MKKIQRFSLIGLFLLIPALQTNQALAFSVSYDQIITSNGTPLARFAVKVKDKNMRVESDMGGAATVIIKNESGYFNYIPDQNMATKIPPNMQRPNLTDDLPNYGEFLKRNNAVVSGSEKIQGYETDIYQFTDPVTGETKIWVWKEKIFPLKIEIKEATGRITTVDLTNVQFDPPTDETTFQLPSTVNIMELQASGGLVPPKAVQASKKEVVKNSKDAAKKLPNLA